MWLLRMVPPHPSPDSSCSLVLLTIQKLIFFIFLNDDDEDSFCIKRNDDDNDGDDDDDDELLVKLGQGLISRSKNGEMSGGIVQHWEQA